MSLTWELCYAGRVRAHDVAAGRVVPARPAAAERSAGEVRQRPAPFLRSLPGFANIWRGHRQFRYTGAVKLSQGLGRVMRAAWLRSVVVAALAAGGYFLFIPITHLESARLAGLVVTRPGISGFKTKPSGASVQPASKSALGAIRRSAAQAPNATGGYTVSWNGTKSPEDALSLSVMLLADPAHRAARPARRARRTWARRPTTASRTRSARATPSRASPGRGRPPTSGRSRRARRPDSCGSRCSRSGEP